MLLAFMSLHGKLWSLDWGGVRGEDEWGWQGREGGELAEIQDYKLNTLSYPYER